MEDEREVLRQDKMLIRLYVHKSVKGLQVQNRPPQQMPLWCVNYFELKAIETPQALEKFLPLLKKNLY